MTTIAQADRDAADHWRARLPSIDVEDYYALIRAFARRREQAEAETVAGIVAWLESVEREDGLPFGWRLMIEEGEWKK